MGTGFWRPSIAGLMGFVLLAGLGLAALRNADPYWAAGAHTLAFLALATACACAVVGEGNVRTLSTGFAVFGLGYLLFHRLPQRDVNIFGFGPQSRPALLLELVFVLLQPYLKPMPASNPQDFVYYDQVAQSIDLLFSGLLGAALTGFVAGGRGRRRPDAGGPSTGAGTG